MRPNVLRTRPSPKLQILLGVVFLCAVALIAFIGSLATVPNTDGWYATVTKAPWSPPNEVFAPVWSVLYVLIAAAGWLTWRSGYRASKPNAARPVLVIYAIQLVLNSLWTPAFFGAYPLIGPVAWWIALAIIVALIVTVVQFIVGARRWSKTASWIMVPYLLWLVFATSLNIGLIAVN